MPGLYRFCLLSYGQPTALKFGDNVIWSLEGAQQGDPLGPLLFCLTIQPLLMSLSSELVIAYMDDVTIGGDRSSVARDVTCVIDKGAEYGLTLNTAKCESISNVTAVNISVLTSFHQLTPDTATLLGAPLSTGPAMDACLAGRSEDLARAADRLKLVSAHDALLLLRNCLSASKLLYTLRSARCAGHELLQSFDDLQRSALGRICNVTLTDDQWLQASLPVRMGGLGVRRVSSLAISAFLASAAGTRQLQDQILSGTGVTSDVDFDQSLASRIQSAPQGAAVGKQKAWDTPVIMAEFGDLMTRYTEPRHRARLLAAAAPHSGDWLHAIPIAACGLLLNDDAVRVAVALRLGCTVCEQHNCRCGAVVDQLGLHAFSCKSSRGRIQRHSFINDLICRALTRAGIPAMKEPHGLVRDDGKRPDGLTLLPWHSGRCATWDVTVVDTMGNAYVRQSAVTAASAAETAATRKIGKYSSLGQTHHFYPVAMETLGPMSSSAVEFLSDIGRRISAVTADRRETAFLFQRASVAIQQFNAVCLADTFAL